MIFLIPNVCVSIVAAILHIEILDFFCCFSTESYCASKVIPYFVWHTHTNSLNFYTHISNNLNDLCFSAVVFYALLNLWCSLYVRKCPYIIRTAESFRALLEDEGNNKQWYMELKNWSNHFIFRLIYYICSRILWSNYRFDNYDAVFVELDGIFYGHSHYCQCFFRWTLLAFGLRRAKCTTIGDVFLLTTKKSRKDVWEIGLMKQTVPYFLVWKIKRN